MIHLLSKDPEERPNATMALHHYWFKDDKDVLNEIL